MSSVRAQLRSNAVALTSLVVALTSVGYNTWRNERTEHNRNVRTAAFEVLTKLAEFERVVFLAQYDHDRSSGNPRIGWTQVIVIHDLATVVQGAVGTRATELRSAWAQNWEGLGQEDEKAIDRIEIAITNLRTTTLDTLRSLK